MLTPYQIYQTYLQGAGAVIRLFEQTLGTIALYGLPPPELQQRTIDSQAAELDRLKERISRLEDELRAAQQDNTGSGGATPS